MDDFFGVHYPLEKLEGISAAMHGAGLPLWVVLYAREMDKAAENQLKEKLPLCDVITFWTWHSSELPLLKANMARVKALVPGKRIVLGCYLWDFGAGGIVPADLMELQLEQGREWLKDGTIHDMIILGSPIIGMGLDTISQTKAWIDAHGAEEVK